MSWFLWFRTLRRIEVLPTEERKDSWPVMLCSLGWALLLVGLVGSHIRFWSIDGTTIIPAFRYSALIAISLLGVGLAASGFSFSTLIPRPSGFAFALGLLFFSEWLTYDYSLLKGPSIRGEILLGFLVCFTLFRHRIQPFNPLLLLGICLLLILIFFNAAQGRMLFSDDHPVFYYRLQLLKENFPYIPFYNPLWNAGIDARDFFATGSLNIFSIFAPLIYFSELQNSYNLIVGLVLFGLLPLTCFFAAKKLELAAPGPTIAALLGISSSLVWYQWALKYGAMGFVTSCALLPLTFALAIKFTSRTRELNLFEAVLLALLTTLTLFWSLAGIIFIPLFAIALLRLRTILRKRYALMICSSILLLSLPWMILFVASTDLSGFLTLKPPKLERGIKKDEGLPIVIKDHIPNQITSHSIRGGGHRFSGSKTIKALREFAGKTNPIILLMFIPGLTLLSFRFAKWTLVITLIWLTTLGSAIAGIRPQLELERMLIVAALLATIPAAAAIGVIFRQIPRASFLAAVIAGYLFASPLSVAFVINNRSMERYNFVSETVTDLAEAIRHYGGEGRTVFPGFILHHLNQGHIAPLIFWSEKPIVASTPFHNLWWYTELVPASIQAEGNQKIEEYLDLLNTTAVVANERKWFNYFNGAPERYQLVWRSDAFTVYKRRQPTPTYFLEGEGTFLGQTNNKATFSLQQPSAVLKFTYFPFLEVEGCNISGQLVAGGKVFVKLSDCPVNQELVLKARTGFARLKGVTNAS